MINFKFAITMSIIAVFSTVTVAADGYRPQNDAQRNYKACPLDMMEKGVELVGSMCGTLPERPVFPGYKDAFTSKLSKAELDAFSARLGIFKNLVAQYQHCINNRVMADGSLSNDTLNFAACADQWAVEQKGKSAEEWGFSCLGQNDWQNPGSSVPVGCFAEVD
jgi:hypothetical protein